MKESFVFYLSWADQVDKLNTEQKAAFLDGIIATARGEDFETEDLAVDILVDIAAGQMSRDADKYEEIRKKRAEYGKRGAQAKAKFAEAKQAKAKNDLAKQADNVYVYDNDNVNVNDNDNVNVNENVNVNGSGGGNVNGNVQAPPTTDLAPEDIFSYFEEIGSKADPQRFIDYYGLEALSNMNWRKVADQWKQTQFTRKPKSDTLYEELMKWAKE